MDIDTAIEISRDAVQEVLPVLEARLEKLFIEVEEAHSKFKSLEKTIAELRSKLNGAQSLPGMEPEPRKRLPKGEAEKMIGNLFGSLPAGSSMTIQEIRKRTGVPYSSAFRTLKNGLYDEKDGKWSARYQ